MCLALRAGHARRRAVREVPKRPERAVPEAEAGAAAWRARGPRAGQAPPGALEVRAVPRSWKVEALAGRLQPEEQPARVAQAPVAQAPAVRAPAVEAQVPPARAQVGCSKPEAPGGVRRV